MTLKIINEGLLGMVINNDENEINKHMLECKTHTLFMAKMAKIDNLFMSNTTFFSVQVKRDIAIFRAWAKRSLQSVEREESTIMLAVERDSPNNSTDAKDHFFSRQPILTIEKLPYIYLLVSFF